MFRILLLFLLVPYLKSLEFLICLHASPPLNETFINTSFKMISDLGASGVRTDVVWAAIEPEPNKYDQNAINYYKVYFQTSLSYNLTSSVLILSSPPQWAKDLWQNGEKDSFLKAWSDYIEIVVKEIGIPLNISRYQVWNEPNAFSSILFWSDIPAILKTGGDKIKALTKNVDIYVNPNCNMLLWSDLLDNWCKNAGESFTGIGIDHYPGTWSLDFNDWYPLEILINRTNTEGDVCYGKKTALMETGYSSFSHFLNHDEKRQSLWIENSLFQAMKIIENSGKLKFKNEFISFYELYDEGDEKTFPPEEAHFGIIKEGNKKIGYESLKKMIRQFSSQNIKINKKKLIK